MTDHADLPIAEFAFPGALRDRLVKAILGRTKTSTTSTLIEYQIEHEALPVVGQRSLVVDSHDVGVAVIEVTEVRIRRLGEVDLAHAIDEGEGFASVSEWRSGHIKYRESAEMRDAMHDPEFTVGDATELVLERFTVIETL